jgi:hypothetical protein
MAGIDDAGAAAVRKYALAALDDACSVLAATPIGGGRWGGRNKAIYNTAISLGSLVGAGALSESAVRAALQSVIDAMPANNDPDGARTTLQNGLTYGMGQPRDLREIVEKARARAQRNPSGWKGRAAQTIMGSRGRMRGRSIGAASTSRIPISGTRSASSNGSGRNSGGRQPWGGSAGTAAVG